MNIYVAIGIGIVAGVWLGAIAAVMRLEFETE